MQGDIPACFVLFSIHSTLSIFSVSSYSIFSKIKKAMSASRVYMYSEAVLHMDITFMFVLINCARAGEVRRSVNGRNSHGQVVEDEGRRQELLTAVVS